MPWTALACVWLTRRSRHGTSVTWQLRVGTAPSRRRVCWVPGRTHAAVAAAIAPYDHCEVAMAAELLPPRLRVDTFLMTDRNIYGFRLWHEACVSGARRMPRPLLRRKSAMVLKSGARWPCLLYTSRCV